MPRRMMEWAVIAAGFVLASGCHGRDEPAKPAPPAANPVAQAAPSPAPEPASIAPSVPAGPAVALTPEAFTITADDAGLQLLAADATEPARDRTAQIAWTAEPT